MSRTYKPFSGPFAPMLTEFVEQKRAVGCQYIAGYWMLRKFDSFSINFPVNNYNLAKEIVDAWGEKQPNESDVYWSNRILYLQQFAVFLTAQGYDSYISYVHRPSRSQFKAHVFTHDEVKRIFAAADVEYLTAAGFNGQKLLVGVLVVLQAAGNGVALFKRFRNGGVVGAVVGAAVGSGASVGFVAAVVGFVDGAVVGGGSVGSEV